ncbi:uncharacterized protein METZ01_LOCUS92316 [marine metagenome]|uniref:Uncharacterized protein n=1 Tax=marine metagenome TaxID=408172 RepID=A0A381VGS4_9ZZZZ
MKAFKELRSEVDELTEFRFIDKAQRKKMKIRMQKLAKSGAFQAKKARARLRMPDAAKLMVQAKKAAKKIILKKFYPKYNEMSMMAKVKIDQVVATKYGAAIDKIGKKQIPKMKKAAMLRVKAAKEKSKEDA